MHIHSDINFIYLKNCPFRLIPLYPDDPVPDEYGFLIISGKLILDIECEPWGYTSNSYGSLDVLTKKYIKEHGFYL